MNLNYLNTIKVLLIVCFVQLLYSCQTDDINQLDSKNSAHENHVTIKTVSGKDIPEILKLVSSESNKNLEFNLKLSSEHKSNRNSITGTLDTNKIRQVTNEEEKSNYTFNFNKNNSNDEISIINYVIKENSSGYYSYFLEFIPDSNWLKTATTPIDYSIFTGSIIIYDRYGNYVGENSFVNGLKASQNTRNSCSDQNQGDDNNPGGGGGNDSGNGDNSSDGQNGNNSDGNNDSDGNGGEDITIDITCGCPQDHSGGNDAPDCTCTLPDTITIYIKSTDSNGDEKVKNALRNPCPPIVDNCNSQNDCEYGFDVNCNCLSDPNDSDNENPDSGLVIDLSNIVSLNQLLNQDLSVSEINWVLNSDNETLVDEILNWLIDHPNHNINFNEARLTVISEMDEIPWNSNIGVFNGISSLAYTHTRVIEINNKQLTQYLLNNTDVLSTGDYGIWHDSEQQWHYYSRELELWFEIPEPSNYDHLDLDFLFNSFWTDFVSPIARYATPLEDIIILLTGNDFDGVSQSRAVAGVFIVVDFLPGAKVLKIVKKSGVPIDDLAEVITKVATQTYKNQKEAVKQWRNAIANATSARKGNFGEMVVDTDWFEKGYETLHVNRVDGIDHSNHHGIDHIFKNPETGEIVIVESKYGTSSINQGDLTTGLPRQMSDNWISNGQLDNDDRLWSALGQNLNLYNEAANNYTRVVAKIRPDGTVVYRYIDSDGFVVLGNVGIFTP